MGEVDLPVVDAQTSALDALNVMQNDGKSAIVVPLPTGAIVLSVGDLVKSLRQGDVTVAEAAGASVNAPYADPLRGQVVHERIIINSGANFLAEPAAVSRVATLLTERRAAVAVVSIDRDRATVVTDHEFRRDSMAARATLCRCTVIKTHVFQPEDLLTPGKCNYPHHVDVKCS